MAREPQRNERAPITDGGQLAPPIVRAPIFECAQAVHVRGFIPHALVNVFANGTELIAQASPYIADADLPTTRPLKVGDVITATQKAFGLDSVHSIDPVTVGHQPGSLAKPSVGPTFFACGQVVPVGNLNPSTHVEVYTADTNPVPIVPQNLIGTAENTGASVPVETQPLKEGWFVAARQVSCPGTPHEIHSAQSDSHKVPPEPNPVPAPTLDPPTSGDVVIAHQLKVGAEVTITDDNTGNQVASGLATGEDNWIEINPDVNLSHKYHPMQALCSKSPPGPSVTPTNTIPTPTLHSPICPDTKVLTVSGCPANAAVVLFKSGSSTPLAAGGGTMGSEALLALGPQVHLTVGEKLYVMQYTGAVGISASSNIVVVSDCRNVVTQHNDMRRTGAYLHETKLTPTSVQGPHFGRLFEREVDGSPYAQILYVRNVHNTPQGTKNLFFVATSTNYVYAFDADDLNDNPSTAAVWKTVLGATRMLNAAEICRETLGTVGITSTPVIDVEHQTMYVVAEHWPPGSPSAPGQTNLNGEHYLHALKLSDGTDRVQPVKIGGHDPRTRIDFKASVQRNRPGLLLLNGVVYIGFATFNCDQGDYHGWVFGYRALDLVPAGIFCTSTDNNTGSGIWQSGNGLVGSDDGHIYFETGNETGGPMSKYGDCFIRLRVTPDWPGLEEAGHFQPSNAKRLREGDLDAQGHPIPDDGRYANGTPAYDHWGDTDLGSGGPVLLPEARVIGGGKQGRLYVLNSYSMHPTQDQSSPDKAKIGQGFQAFKNTYRDVAGDESTHFQIYGAAEGFGPNIHGGPCYWPGPSLLYQMAEKDYLRAFRYDRLSARVLHGLSAISDIRAPWGMPGGHSSLSANGNNDGIVWTCYPQGDGQWTPQQGNLVAFNATPDKTHSPPKLNKLWQDAGDEHTNPEWFAKFNPPTIADGKVFRPCFAQYKVPVDASGHDTEGAPTVLKSGKVIVYGLAGRRNRKHIGRPKQDISHIEQKWQWVGGSGVLAAPVAEEHDNRDDRGGRRRDFVGHVNSPNERISVRFPLRAPTCDHPPETTVPVKSSIFWSPETNAHIVTGEILEEYIKQGGPAGKLGYPVADEADTSDGMGRISYFEQGHIVWDKERGAQTVVV